MIFLKLILAHLLGDFIFQPNSWVADKENKKWKSIYLYIHSFIHFLLMTVLLWDYHLLWLAGCIAMSHFFIDLLKLQFQTKKTRKKWFFLDQILHIFVILIFAYLLGEINMNFIHDKENLKLIIGLIFVTFPCSIIVKNIISTWVPDAMNTEKIETDSLSNAGKYIGILERILVFIFIVVNHWEGVGFMIAAKSVFRFSDLAQAKQRKLTEYVLIGTLLSFGLAIITGILIKI